MIILPLSNPQPDSLDIFVHPSRLKICQVLAVRSPVLCQTSHLVTTIVLPGVGHSSSSVTPKHPSTLFFWEFELQTLGKTFISSNSNANKFHNPAIPNQITPFKQICFLEIKV
jgi:hypothetical protein